MVECGRVWWDVGSLAGMSGFVVGWFTLVLLGLRVVWLFTCEIAQDV